jgi:arginine kinase
MSDQIVQKSLMAQVLPAVYQELKELKTYNDGTLMDVIMSGVANPDSSVGCYATDPEAYKTFAPFFNEVIKRYHGFDPNKQKHVTDLNVDGLTALSRLEDDRIISTRIRCGRNLANMPFAPTIKRKERQKVEAKVSKALGRLRGDLQGEYYSLGEMSDEVRAQMIKDHFLFKEGDRFLEAAGCNRDWPEGRGIFHNKAKTALVWVNEEDQLRIIAMEKGADFVGVFIRFANLVNELSDMLTFAHDERLGYLGSCPTNIGTAMRASVHVALPKLAAAGKLEALAKVYGLSVRGIHGEHSESEGGVYDISNKKRLGVSEVEGVRLMHDGLVNLLWAEDAL